MGRLKLLPQSETYELPPFNRRQVTEKDLSEIMQHESTDAKFHIQRKRSFWQTRISLTCVNYGTQVSFHPQGDLTHGLKLLTIFAKSERGRKITTTKTMPTKSIPQWALWASPASHGGPQSWRTDTVTGIPTSLTVPLPTSVTTQVNLLDSFFFSFCTLQYNTRIFYRTF